MAFIAGTNTAGAIRAVRSRLAGVMKVSEFITVVKSYQ